MSQEERHGGQRDLTYSAWHRRHSTRRFVGINQAQLLAQIDLDASLWVEYDDGTKEPLALIESARDVGQWKPGTVTRKLAEKAGIPAFVVLYTPSQSMNPADKRWPDIARFRVRELAPTSRTDWKVYTPEEWARKLLSLREDQSKRLDAQIAELIAASKNKPDVLF